MQSGKIRFNSMREISAWTRRTGGSLLGSIRTVLKEPPHPREKSKPTKTAARRALNRKALPMHNADEVARKTAICEAEKGCWATIKCTTIETPQEGHVWRTSWAMGCKSPNCALCRRAYATKRAREAWGRDGENEKGAYRFLNAANKIPWWQIVLTYPRYLRPKCTQESVKQLRDLFWKQFQEFAFNRQGLDDQDLTMGCSEVMHPVGDKKKKVIGEDGKEYWEGEGEEVFHPHLNFIIPAVAFGGRRKVKGEDGKEYWKQGSYKAPDGLTYNKKRLRVWMHKRELEEIRGMWKRALEKVYNTEIDGNVVIDVKNRGVVTRKLDLEKALRKQKHCLKYNFRSFPGWPAWTRRITNYGYLAPRKIGNFREEWESWEPEDYREHQVCPCGEELEFETDDIRSEDMPSDPVFDGIFSQLPNLPKGVP